MQDELKRNCPECDEQVKSSPLPRRDFIRVLGGGAVALAGLSAAQAGESKKKAATPAENLAKELYATLSPEQKQELTLPWDHQSDGRPTRLGMYNRALLNKRIGDEYTKTQQELIDRILKAISSDEQGYQQITRKGSFDGSRSLENCGALYFGEPEGERFVWVFTGHHLTVRCDGDHQDGVAFGGPMYYGHSPNGYTSSNVFHYQTESVLSVYAALDEKQREQAVVTGSPGEQYPSVRFREEGQSHPGIAFSELSGDQRELVETVMRTVLSPYRKEDADEVMQIVKANGGMDGIHLAFYRDQRVGDAERWHFWRLEGPGFVWNYRVLPHVHTYVNIARQA